MDKMIIKEIQFDWCSHREEYKNGRGSDGVSAIVEHRAQEIDKCFMMSISRMGV